MGSFGKTIRAHRNKAQVSPRTLAYHLGISHVFLGSIERGERPLLPNKYWPTLVDALPTLNLSLLERQARVTKGVHLNIKDSNHLTQEVVLTLEQRIQDRSLSNNELECLLEILDPTKRN